MPDYDFNAEAAHVAHVLVGIERSLHAAAQSFRALDAAVSAEQRERLFAEYEKIANEVASSLRYLERNFSHQGPLAARVATVVACGADIFAAILERMGLDPEDPGLSEKVELRKAAVLGRSKANDVKKALDGLKAIKGKVASGAELVFAVAILAELSIVLFKNVVKKLK
jgi:hypothetical protein